MNEILKSMQVLEFWTHIDRYNINGSLNCGCIKPAMFFRRPYKKWNENKLEVEKIS